MTEDIRIVEVDASNVEQEGFFCYKSKPNSEGYQKKLAWLKDRFAEGMIMKILYEGERSVAFFEAIPGQHTWRVVNADDYLVIHCLWVVGKGKGKGYATRLLEACLEDARALGLNGVAMVTSSGNWLVDAPIFLKNGFEEIDTAPPSFKLLAYPLNGGQAPAFPNDWDERLRAFGDGVTLVYADQCPYMPDAVEGAVQALAERGLEAKVIYLGDSAEVRARSPSPYGVYAIVIDGQLFSYHYLGKKELRQLDEHILLDR